METIAEWWLWLTFFVLIFIFLLIDLLLIGGQRRHHMTLKESFLLTATWISLALLFNLFLWLYLRQTYPIPFANQMALEFLTAYLVEKSLSMDNVFVFKNADYFANRVYFFNMG